MKPARSIFEAARSSRARRDARRTPRADPLPDDLRRLIRRAAERVPASERATFIRKVETALRDLPQVGDGALHRIIKTARSGQRMPKFDARSLLDQIKDADAKAAATPPS